MTDRPSPPPSAPSAYPAGTPPLPYEGNPHLHPDRIIATVKALSDRIEERFPGSGLGRLARQQLAIARNTLAQVEWAQKPILWVRFGVGVVILLIAGVLAGITLRVRVSPQGMEAHELVQVVEAAVNEILLLGAAVVFLATTESRLKRRRALTAIRELRAVAHIVDMHQLTKDPERYTTGGKIPDTPSSPQRTMTRWELARYLDYCSEMLALNSKLAALYAQHLDDPVVLAAVDEVETLTTGLTAKIWQKLVIVNRATD